MMKNLIKTLILGVTLLASATGTSAEQVNKKDPYQMIQKVADITFKRFANEQAAIKVEPNLLKNIVREELMPYINYQYAAYKVIGSNFKKTNKAERAQFVPAFREYLITSYAQVFTETTRSSEKSSAGANSTFWLLYRVKTCA